MPADPHNTGGMVDPESLDENEISLFALATAVVARRWRILRWALAGGVLAAVWAFTRPQLYVANTSFITQGTDPSRSGLATIAGQFGIAIPTGNQSTSPDLYVKVLKSRVVLQTIARDTFVVPELGGSRRAAADLFDIPNQRPARREELVIRKLDELVDVAATKTTGLVEVIVTTRWPSVSLAIASMLVARVNEFNQHTRQSQAEAERQFVEGRVAVAAAELRASEDRLESFLRGNREFSGSAELTFARDRLQRDVALKQQVYTTLASSLDDARIREVRDTPVITVIEPPAVSAFPQPQRRVIRVLLGVLFGGFVGVVWTLISDGLTRRREEGNRDLATLMDTLSEAKGEITGEVRRLRQLGGGSRQ